MQYQRSVSPNNYFQFMHHQNTLVQGFQLDLPIVTMPLDANIQNVMCSIYTIAYLFYIWVVFSEVRHSLLVFFRLA